MKKRFTEEQIIGVLKEGEAGLKPAELCRKHGISEATYYNWKAKFGGMTVSDAQRLKELEHENNKLKRHAVGKGSTMPVSTMHSISPGLHERLRIAISLERLMALTA